ncbi:MAG TPA: class I tRNA ligase family protein, partial [Verrucomicrobiae bacterium]|nr:class I tRNA ligase family protein [Verrucomicrobiae bacterium]
PALICTSCNESVLDPQVARIAAKRFGEAGAGVWWSDPVERYLPPGFACERCGGSSFEKEKNIVDIWFESGVTHLAVLGKDGMPWPSDLVLEGGDQYRGWFRSSLLTAVATEGRAPYRRVVKNGWVNDEQGRAMSKSLGTGIDAREAMNRWGADVLRLWAASVEFVDDVRFGPNVVDQVGRVYRNIRNRIRFMLSNLDDLEASDVVAVERMRPFDRLACSVADAFASGVRDDYHAFDIHGAYLRVVEFESSMSGLYFDALKDPLYSRAMQDPRRRSAQSALLHVLERLLTAIAPVLSFTAEEAWQALPERLRGGAESVFDTSLFATHAKAEARAADAELWQILRDLRARAASGDGPRDFEARARIVAPPTLHARLLGLGDELREAMVVSQLELEMAPREEGGGVAAVELTPALGEKCARCWKYRRLGDDPEHPSICAECAQVVRALDAAR